MSHAKRWGMFAGFCFFCLFAAGVQPVEPLVTLDVKEADIQNVFRLLARVGQVNIVVSEQVRGRVTLRLQEVVWTDAFQAILKSHGLGAERIGNVIWVDELTQIARRAQETAQLNAAQQQVAELKTVVIPINYARVDEIRPILEKFLSERGYIISDPRTNRLIVTDVEANLARVLALVQ